MNLLMPMQKHIDSAIVELLMSAGNIARQSGGQAFLVGGAVRDVLLGITTTDIDVMVEGDARYVALKLSERVNGKTVVHNTFGTVTLETDSGIKIDFATARTEYYPSPGALPVVSSSTMEKDLGRRDFSINAMAVDLSPDSFGEVVDRFSGVADLENKKIRVLHKLSFRDDPTRIFRAVKFAARLGFAMDELTDELLKDAVAKGAIGTVSGSRLKKELQLIASESMACEIVHILNKYGLGEAICGGFTFNIELLNKRSGELQSADVCYSYIESIWKNFLASVVFNFPEDVLSALSVRLAMEKDERSILKSSGSIFIKKVRESLCVAERISDVVRTLSGIPCEVIACIYASVSDSDRKKLDLYEERKNVELEINGNDLAAMGYEKNAFMGSALNKLRDMKIDGEIDSRDHELLAALRVLESSCENEV